MKEKILMALLLATQIVSANVIVSEIMYAPTQTTSETDGEWLELYNAGNASVNLADYKINGYNFDDSTLEPDSYAVVARELVDGSDEDTESFESYWGNNDGVWNQEDTFQAMDGFMSLANDQDIINISSPAYTYIASYIATEGSLSGRTLIWNGSGFSDGRIDGTPGRGEQSNNEVLVTATIKDTSIKLEEIYINDRNDTYEIIPFTDSFTVRGTFSGPVANASFNFQNQDYPLTIQNNTFSGSIPFEASTAGSYEAYLFLENSARTLISNLTLVYPEVIATVLQGDAAFGELEPGLVSQPRQLQIINAGNTPITVTLAATNLYSEAGSVSNGLLEVFVNNNWNSLSSNLNLGSLTIQGNLTLDTRMNVPLEALSGNYEGYIRVVSSAL